VRFPEVDGCRNFRDVGGYRLADGGTTRWGRLYRSDFLSTRAEIHLAALGIAEVIDLRTTFERNDRVLPRASHLALFESIPARWWSSPDDLSPPAIAERYLGMLESGAANVAEIARRIANSDGAVAIHCAAGRDRTGVVIGTLLSLIGVHRDDIADDYALSAGRCEDSVPCDRRAMELFLASIEREHSDARALVKVTDDELSALRARLT